MYDKEESEIETDAGDNKTGIINVDTDNDTNAGAGKHSQAVNYNSEISLKSEHTNYLVKN